MKRLALIGATLLCVPVGSSGLAQVQDGAWEACIGTDIQPQAAMAACSLLLLDGELPVHRLAQALQRRGDLYLAQRHYELAIADFDRAISLLPTLPGAFNSRGLAYSSTRDYIQAIADYTRAIMLLPNYPAALRNRGLAYLETRSPLQASADFSEALRLNPIDTEMFFFRAVSHFMLADYRSAVADLGHTEVSASVLYLRGHSLLRMGRTAEGKADIDAAVAQNAAVSAAFPYIVSVQTSPTADEAVPEQTNSGQNPFAIALALIVIFFLVKWSTRCPSCGANWSFWVRNVSKHPVKTFQTSEVRNLPYVEGEKGRRTERHTTIHAVGRRETQRVCWRCGYTASASESYTEVVGHSYRESKRRRLD